MKKRIGKMIFKLREEIGGTLKSLSRGLLSVSELSRIEQGEKEAEWIILEALFERLGKSLDKFEMVVTIEEYHLHLLRKEIVDSLLEDNSARARKLLKCYQDWIDGAELIKEEAGEWRSKRNEKKRVINVLHIQYVNEMQVLCEYVEGQPGEDCIYNLNEALRITFPAWQTEDWTETFLCRQEMQIILLITYLHLEIGNLKEAVELAERLMEYINRRVTDEDAKVGIVPQCTWILALIYAKQGNAQLAFEICEEGKRCLQKKGVLTVLKELLLIEQDCLIKKGNLQEAERRQKQIEAIGFLYEMSEYPLHTRRIFNCIKTERRCEIILVHELLRDLRLVSGMSQEELSWGICTQETLSRIEGGRRPNKKKMRQLLEKLGSDREIYYGYIVAEEYSVYEKAAQFKQYEYCWDMENSLKILAELEKELDMSLPVNRQFVEVAYVKEKVRKKELNDIEAIRELEKILCYTMKFYQGTVYRVPYRQEFIILNQIAIFMKSAGMQREALELYAQILEQYKKSTVSERDHMLSEILLYTNYAATLEKNGKSVESEEIAKCGMRLFVKCERGDLTSLMLANLAWIYEKREEGNSEELCELCVRHGFYLQEMYGRKQACAAMKKYYDRKFGEKIGEI